MRQHNENTAQAERLEEYRTVRSELLMHIDHNKKGQAFLLMLATTILSFAITNEQPWLCFLAWVLTFYFWRAYRNDAAAYIKLGRYIAVFHEAQSSGLGWESRVAKADGFAPERVSLSTTTNPLLSSFCKLTAPHPVMSLASLVVGIIMIASQLGIEWTNYSLLAGVFVVVVVHSIIVLKLCRSQWPEQRAYWTSMFEQIRDAEMRELQEAQQDKSSVRGKPRR